MGHPSTPPQRSPNPLKIMRPNGPIANLFHERTEWPQMGTDVGTANGGHRQQTGVSSFHWNPRIDAFSLWLRPLPASLRLDTGLSLTPPQPSWDIVHGPSNSGFSIPVLISCQGTLEVSPRWGLGFGHRVPISARRRGSPLPRAIYPPKNWFTLVQLIRSPSPMPIGCKHRGRREALAHVFGWLGWSPPKKPEPPKLNTRGKQPPPRMPMRRFHPAASRSGRL